MSDFSSYLDSASKYLSDAWNGTDPSKGKPVVQIPSPENNAPQKPNEPWYSSYLPSTEELKQLASDAGTALQNKAKYYDETYLAPAQEWVSEKSDEAIAYYEETKAEAYNAASSALASAEKLYEENKEVVLATAIAGPLGGLAVYGAKQLLEDEATEETTQPEEITSPPVPEATDPKELLFSESTDPVEAAADTTHARTVASNDTAEETSYRSEPKDTESSPTTTAKTTVVYTAPQQPKAAQNVTTTTAQTTEIVEPVVNAKASTEATAQAARTAAPEPSETETATNEVASNTQPATATTTSTPVVAVTEAQQTSDSDSGSPDSGNSETSYYTSANSDGPSTSVGGLAGLVGDPLGRTVQNSGTTSQSAGNNNTATNSELAANATSSASTVSNSSNKSTVSNNARTTADAKTQTSPEAVASTQPQQSADPRQPTVGVKLPGQDTQNDSGNTTASTNSSSAALLAAAVAHAGVQQGIKNDSSSKGTHLDSKLSGEVAQADSEKVNGTGNPLENDSGSNQGNPFGNQAETVAALTDLENQFWGENEDYPVDHIATDAIFTSASQISTFG